MGLEEASVGMEMASVDLDADLAADLDADLVVDLDADLVALDPGLVASDAE